MPVVAHCVALYLHTSGAWLHAQLACQRRYQPLVLAQETANLDEFPAPLGFCAEALPGLPRLYNRLVRRLTGEYPLYAAVLRQRQAVLIHAHFGHQGARCLRARRHSGLPMVTSFYGADASEFARIPVWRRRYARLFSVGEAFIAEGSAMRQQLIDIGCPAERIHVHHLGVDLGRLPFRERRRSRVPRLLICAGFREKKGIPYGLRALAAVRDRGQEFRLVLIGDGPERGTIERLLHELDLELWTEMRGMLPYSAVIEELQRCDVLLQPSVTATNGDTEGGAPVILLDAQACGLPVVATRHADIPEYVRHGETGLLVPERDAETLADALLELLGKGLAWPSLGRAGREHVRRQYNAELQGRRLECLYDAVL